MIMAGGLHFTPEQIRNLPYDMQVQIGLSIATQMIQTTPVVDQEIQTTEEEHLEM